MSLLKPLKSMHSQPSLYEKSDPDHATIETFMNDMIVQAPEEALNNWLAYSLNLRTSNA